MTLKNRRSKILSAGAGGAASAAVLVAAAGVGPAAADTPVDRPDTFTSAYTVMATPDEVVSPDGEPVGGEAEATGTFTFMLNSDEEIICYNIELNGVTPPYMSMARTATHIHEGGTGISGPPRISFPDPAGAGDVLTSSGCVQGPFSTGLEGSDGTDTGAGFTLADIEAAHANFYADTHTSAFVPGAVRGQLTPIPVGGVETGAGGSVHQEQSRSAAAVAVPLAAIAVLLGGGAVWLARRLPT